MSSATRMLVLGSIRILQPVHGYDVRRELLTWRLDEIANVKPGSIYGAMRTLEKDGCIAVHSRESGERKPKRTMYMLTGEGDKQFLLMLRAAWWTVTAPTEPLIPALCLMPFMARDELVRALQARLGRLEGELDSTAFSRRSIRTGASGADGRCQTTSGRSSSFAPPTYALSWTGRVDCRSGSVKVPISSAGRKASRASVRASVYKGLLVNLDY